MSVSSFAPSFDTLPATLPVFPLPGALLLPGGKLPLATRKSGAGRS